MKIQRIYLSVFIPFCLLLSFLISIDVHAQIGNPSFRPNVSSANTTELPKNVTWQIETITNTVRTGQQLRLDDNDLPHVMFEISEPTTASLGYAVRRNNRWESEKVDGMELGGSISFDLMTSQKPFVAYSRCNPFYCSPFFAELLETGWRISPGVGSGSGSVALDSLDQPHFSYFEGIVANEVSLKYASRISDTWSTAVIDFGNPGDPSLQVDSANKPHIAYGDSAGGPLHYAFLSAGTWVTEVVASQMANSVSLAIDTSNQPHIAYWDKEKKDLNYAFKSGTNWFTQTVDTGRIDGPLTSNLFALALDSKNQPHFAYYDADEKAIKYAAYLEST